ncbi:hypothetical protein H8959_020141, partial [Pygathrix nigripes]
MSERLRRSRRTVLHPIRLGPGPGLQNPRSCCHLICRLKRSDYRVHSYNTYKSNDWYIPCIFTLMAIFFAGLISWVCFLLWKYGNIMECCQKTTKEVSNAKPKKPLYMRLCLMEKPLIQSLGMYMNITAEQVQESGRRPPGTRRSPWQTHIPFQ